MSNEVAYSFAKNASDTNYNPKFREFKNQNSIQGMNSNLEDNSPINHSITTSEIRATLQQCKNTSPGPDKILHILLKNLTDNSVAYLQKIYNLIWKYGVFPTRWSDSIIVPIRKRGKDRRQSTSYRPIALTCTMCKIVDKIVSKRLRWHLEKEKFFDPNQSGFRQNRSTLDPLINLETNICDAFVNDQHLLTVFLDIKKAYEMVWRNHIIQVLSNNKVRGSMLEFIKNFLRHRYIQVRVNGQLENSVPQGSVLSVTLFLVSFNDVNNCFKYPVKSSKFADDITFYCKGKDPKITEKLIQESLNSLQK